VIITEAWYKQKEWKQQLKDLKFAEHKRRELEKRIRKKERELQRKEEKSGDCESCGKFFTNLTEHHTTMRKCNQEVQMICRKCHREHNMKNPKHPWGIIPKKY
jgi:hypothetical protein